MGLNKNYYVAEGWRDNIVMLNLGQGGGVAEPDFVSFIGNMKAWAFDNGTEEELYITFHVDHDYKPGTTVFPHVHWTPSNAAAGVVRWGIEISKAKSHGQEAFISTTTIYIEQATGEVDRLHNIAEQVNGIFGDGDIEPDAILVCRLFRDASHVNDTYNADAFALSVDLHYQVDRNSTPQKAPNFYDQPYIEE